MLLFSNVKHRRLSYYARDSYPSRLRVRPEHSELEASSWSPFAFTGRLSHNSNALHLIFVPHEGAGYPLTPD